MRPLVRLISRLLPWLMAASASAAQPLRVMPLGDSITAGSYGAGKDGIGGYRAVLTQHWFRVLRGEFDPPASRN